MLVVDLLHEFELGVWKALFTHLIQILHAAAPMAVWLSSWIDGMSAVLLATKN